MNGGSRGIVLRAGKRAAKPKGIIIEEQVEKAEKSLSNSPDTIFCRTGKFGKTLPRPTTKKPVDYNNGGSDFRCPHSISSFTFQSISRPHTTNDPVPRFSKDSRFKPRSSTPGYTLGHTSSLGKQFLSQNHTNKGFGFGTSTRDCGLKLYTISTCNQNR